jgi:hypothetical protein
MDNDVTAVTARLHLEELARHLGRCGWYARLVVPESAPPRLHVVNPELPAMEDHLTIAHNSNAWWLWWSWAQPIGPAHDLDGAVARITTVLAARVH